MSLLKRSSWCVLQAACAILTGACGSEDPEPPQGSIPCNVQAVLEAKCLRCHGPVLQNGAPVHLGTLAQIHAVHEDRRVYELMRVVLEMDFMPPNFIPLDPPVEPLTADEKATLLQWVTAGAPGETNPRCP